MRSIEMRISKIIILFILFVNIVGAQVETIGNMAQNNTNNTGFAKDLVVYLPVSKVIDGINDAIIDIMMQNPSNDTMYVQINIAPLPNIYIYGGEGFTQSGDNKTGSFIVGPGQNKTVEVRIKSDKTGTYSIDFNGQYWFSSNTNSKFNIKTYTLPVEVKTPSINAKGGPSSPVTPPGIPDNNTITPQTSSTITPEPSTTRPVPEISIGFIFLVISIVYLYKKLINK